MNFGQHQRARELGGLIGLLLDASRCAILGTMSNSFTFRAPEDLSAMIREVSASRSKPVSVLIREAIRYGLPVQHMSIELVGRSDTGPSTAERKQ